MTDLQTRDVAYSRGVQQVSIGDKFRDNLRDGVEWEVVRWSDTRTYSPSGIGGTPCAYCKPLSDPGDFWRRYIEPDGTAEWCADSIAALIATNKL